MCRDIFTAGHLLSDRASISRSPSPGGAQEKNPRGIPRLRPPAADSAGNDSVGKRHALTTPSILI